MDFFIVDPEIINYEIKIKDLYYRYLTQRKCKNYFVFDFDQFTKELDRNNPDLIIKGKYYFDKHINVHSEVAEKLLQPFIDCEIEP